MVREAYHSSSRPRLIPTATSSHATVRDAKPTNTATRDSDAIEHALAAMRPASREVLLLVAVAGLSHSDAADVCGITPEALRQRVSRARAQLARALEDDCSRVPVFGEVTP
jgi:RNA polymerase sigma factor (sigma-70 family)